MSTLKDRESLINKLITIEVLNILLKDHTTGGNIIWATDDYYDNGFLFSFNSEIYSDYITGDNSKLIIPRVKKKLELKSQRSKEKAEVFTPSWVCNCQNNMIDNAWFGRERRRFNTEHECSWETNYYPITFPSKDGKTWEDYVNATRLEVSCGEAPYLTSRYDTVSGKPIPVKNRIGLLDRKLRVIGENVSSKEEWLKWSEQALKATYGFEWQGDNLFLARKNILSSVIEAFYDKYNDEIENSIIVHFAEIISWNIWQMDGIKMVIPNSCHETEIEQLSLFETETKREKCPGCLKGDIHKHNGIYALIMDWNEKKTIRFVDMLKGAK